MDINDHHKTDLIIIPAIDEQFNLSLKQNKALIQWVVEQYKAGAEVASLCTGAFLLASTGLLAGRQCSTHWNVANEFKTMFPDVKLAAEKIITDEHGIYTTGGAISSLNLVLYIVEKYYDRPTAIYCAKIFEIDIDRNTQSPFAIFTGQKNHEDEEIKKVQEYMETNVGRRLFVEAIASMFSIDRRNFDRRFKKATRNTPAEYLQRIKVEAAKKSFETTRKNINEVMYEIGYTDTKAFRTIFKKLTGLSPVGYRSKYNKEKAVV
jgi:transcriptional regulator GlxA family with amidase domain